MKVIARSVRPIASRSGKLEDRREYPRHAVPFTALSPFAAHLQGPGELNYPLHDKTVMVTTCGRIWFNRQKINLSQVFAGQKVGIKQVDERVWLATFMHYDLGYFDDETCRLEPLQNPFGPKVLPMSPE
jgi:putative transposase